MGRNKKIILEKKNGKGYAEIGRKFNLSRQRIYQIYASNQKNAQIINLKNEKKKCGDCGQEKTVFKPLGIHHIDGNPRNNNKNNLIVLCQSCHAIRHKRNNMARPTTWKPGEYRKIKLKLTLETVGRYQQVLKIKGKTMQQDFEEHVNTIIK